MCTDRERSIERMTKVCGALTEVKTRLSQAKKVSEAANVVCPEIVKRVFNISRNKVWRDFFVRVAPLEPFVPAFRLPHRAEGKIEAVLETLHRSGKGLSSLAPC
ncbi:hypothetical protein VSR69_21340 [Paraburkholderia phytofirmans]